MRPIGPDNPIHLPRNQSVGDGPKPSADVSVSERPDARLLSNAAKAVRIPVASLGKAPGPGIGAVPGPASAKAASPGVLRILAALGLPPGQSSAVTVAAMIAERLPLDAGTAAVIRRFARKHDDDPAASRIAARAAAAGLDPDGPEAEHLFAAVGDRSGGESADHQPGGQSDASGDGERWPRSPDEPGLIGARLEQAVRDALANPDMARMVPPGLDGRGWACVPFSIPVCGVVYQGFIRIWYDAMKKHAGPIVVDVRGDDGRRVFEVNLRGDGRHLRYFSDNSAENDSFSEYFRKYGAVQTARLSEGDTLELDIVGAIDEDV